MSISSVSYEVYNLGLVLRSALLEGASIRLEDMSYETPITFVPRTSPGYITSTKKMYTYVVLEFPNKPPLEAHIGIRVAGRAGVLHQCDIAVLTKLAAERCRRRSELKRHNESAAWISPKYSDLVLAIECKLYEKSCLDVDLARSFIGLVSDISLRSYYFVASSLFPDSIKILLNSKGKKWAENINPYEDVEVNRLINMLRYDFRNYIWTH